MMHSKRIVSLADVLKLHTQSVFPAMTYLAGVTKWMEFSRAELGNRLCAFSPEQFLTIVACAVALKQAGETHGLIVTKAFAERLEEALKEMAPRSQSISSDDISVLLQLSSQAIGAFIEEANGQLLFVMPSKHAGFYSDDKALFGEEVDDAFPSAASEILEAGKCRALGRWTACVMHLMRALEVGLGALAKYANVEPDENWNTLLQRIEANLRAVGKKSHSP